MWQKIEQIVVAHGWGWKGFAEMIGESPSRVSKWKGGEGVPGPVQLLKIAKVLGTGTEFLADDSLDEPLEVQHLGDDEREILKAYRAIRPQLQNHEAVRHLLAAMNGLIARVPRSGDPIDMQTNEPVKKGSDAVTERKRQA